MIHQKWLAARQDRGSLEKVFRNADLCLTYSYGKASGKIYPKIHSVRKDDTSTTYAFSLPTGLDPKEVKKKEYCFRQVFGERIEIKGDVKRFVLTVFNRVLPSEITYEYKHYKEHTKGLKLPILVGLDMNNEVICYDMVKNPHLLIAGETGSGKSTQLRSILSTLILTNPPERMQLFLCDLKRSEFHLFKRVKHVQSVLTHPFEMVPTLDFLFKEMGRRGDLLDQHEVAHIDDLKEKLPYLVLCIDEVALLKKEKVLMSIVEDISSIGRALGIFLILSMQRPDSKIMEGALKNNLTVRMGFKCADSINARIIGTPGSEKLNSNGRMLLKLDGVNNLKEIQAPYLSVELAKGLLEPYKSQLENKPLESINEVPEFEETLFEVLDE